MKIPPTTMALWFLVILIAGFSVYPPQDPDLFWHLRVGQDLWNGIFPYEDRYSFTMEGYRWINHSWLLDGIMYALYSVGGYLLLAVPFMATFLGAGWIAIRTGRMLARSDGNSLTGKKKWLFELSLLLLFLILTRHSLGTRVQMVTLLGVSLTHFALWQFWLSKKPASMSNWLSSLKMRSMKTNQRLGTSGEWKRIKQQTGEALKDAYHKAILSSKVSNIRTYCVEQRRNQHRERYFSELPLFIYFLPLAFLLWTQMHGGFAIGLGFIGWWCLFHLAQRFFQKDTPLLNGKLKLLGTIGLICFLVTFINPYGPRLYLVIWQHLIATYPREVIVEWQPINGGEQTGIQFILALLIPLLMMVVSGYRPNNYWLFTLPFILIWTLGSVRNIAVMIILLLPWWYQFSAHWIQHSGEEKIKRISHIFLQPRNTFQLWWGRCFFSVLAITAVLFSLQRASTFWLGSTDEAFLAKQRGYPYQAIQEIKNRVGNQEITIDTGYNWGGYTLWHLPQAKVSIDGRMMVWESPRERKSFLEEYQEWVERHEYWGDEYAVDCILRSHPQFSFENFILIYSQENEMHVWCSER